MAQLTSTGAMDAVRVCGLDAAIHTLRVDGREEAFLDMTKGLICE